MSDTFQRYIHQGYRAVETHPDYAVNDFLTSASDTIASILHAALEALSEDDRYTEFDPEDLLGRALRTYYGDMEDK